MMGLFNRKKEAVEPTDLAYPLLQLQNADKDRPDVRDVWRLEDAVRGVQIFGGIGSGKTSGSGRELALAYLQNGYGGIVLCGKVDEKDNWLQYAKETNRLEDVIVFEPHGPYTFNPLQYEMNRSKDEGGGHTANIVSLFLSLVKMGNRLEGGSEGLGGREPFWILALKRGKTLGIDLLRQAKLGKQLVGGQSGSEFDLTVVNISKLFRDMPIGQGHFRKFSKLTPPSSYDQHAALQEWADQSYTIYALTWASAYVGHLEKQLDNQGDRNGNSTSELRQKSESETRALEAVSSYFLSEFPQLAEKTRSSILEHLFAFATPFRSGILADHFAVGTSPEILPEETFKGKIIILNWPVKKYLDIGIYAQSMCKTMWQQAVERRFIDKTTRPVFMWIDEAQYFISNEDMLFQTTARSSRACTVLLSQNISNYYACMGGSNARAFVDSLLGNLATKIFHNNNDAVTNEWAAETIAKDYRGNLTLGDSGSTIGEEFQYQFLPKNFTILLTGGKTNHGIVEAVVTVAGREWSNGKNFLKTNFYQDLK